MSFSITGKSRGKDAKADSASQDKDAVYSVVSHMERTLFIVDLSKLEAEGDTLAEALVVYRPFYEFKKSQYEQRCSQVIGISLCMKNLSGKYPKFLLMRGTGFAIQGFGSNYIMGLSSRPDEPGSCAVKYLETVCSYFRFYYHSPEKVMQSSPGDWENFTATMTSIFNSIMDYVTADQHSVPAMLKPLPYFNSVRKNQQIYMLSMRVLRTCQKYAPILGGSIMYSSKLVVGQFPPSLLELLILIGGGGVELDKKSILEDNIAPGKVWVLEVYLTREELQLAHDQRKDLSAFQATYASLDVNPNLSNSMLHWRFQSSISSSKSSTENIKVRKNNWKRKNIRAKRNSPAPSSVGPVASSTPQQKPSKSGSLKSEEAVMFSPGLSSVTFDNDHIRAKYTKPPQQHGSTAAPTSPLASLATTSPNHTGNDTDELYLDAIDVDPTAAIGPEMLRFFSRSSSHPNGESAKTVGNSSAFQFDIGEGISKETPRGTGSTSSEGFATPSPTPPCTSTSQLPADVSSSFKTAASELSLRAVDEEVDITTSREHNNSTTAGHCATPPILSNEATPTDPTGDPSQVVSEQLSLLTFSHSESEDDFVNSEDIERILRRVAQEKSGTIFSTSSSPPPPLPRRNNMISAVTLVKSSTGPAAETPPPPPVRGTSVRDVPVAEETEKEGTPPPLPPRSRAHSPEKSPMVTGILDHAKGYPYLPLKEGESPQTSKKKAKSTSLQNGTTSTGHPRNAWIYDTLKRSPATGLVLGEDGGGREGSSDSHEATPMPAKEKGGEMGGASNRTDPKDRFTDRDYEDIDDEVSTETGRPKAPALSNTIETGRPKAPVLGNRELPKPPNQETSTRPGIFDDEDYYDDADRVSSETKGLKMDRKVPSKPRLDDKDYEEIDDDIVAEVISESAAARPLVGGTNAPNVAAKSAASDTEQDIGHAALYLENDEEVHDTDESKNSSMTVTLDLSHIDKNDIMYGSVDKIKKVGSGIDMARIAIENDESSAEETGGDGTVTPVEMTYNDSMFALMKTKLGHQKQQKATEPRRGGGGGEEGEETGLNDSAEFSSLPDEDENVFMNSHSELEDSLPDPALGVARENAKTWLPRTLDRKNAGSSDEQVLEKYCVYVQQYMNTFIILLADSGLQHQHSVLNQLWRLLAEQLISLDTTLDESTKKDGVPPKSMACVVSYSGYENLCEAQPLSAAYHFRHAVRRSHQEYLSDPSLRQISLSKEHCRVLSQRVHDREIYYQPGKLGGDALSLHGVLETQAKFKCSLRQQPIGGPKVMFI